MEESKCFTIKINSYTERTKLAEILLNKGYIVSYKCIPSGYSIVPGSTYLIATKQEES